MSIIIIYISFTSLICILAIISTYFISSLISRRAHQRRLNQRVLEVGSLFDRQMEYQNPDDIPPDEIKKIKKLVLTRLGLEAFTQYYTEYAQRNGYNEKLRRYAGQVVDYKTLLKNSIVRDQYRISYILYLLSEYRIHSPEVDVLALRSLKDKSLYTRSNALRVIKNTEDVELMIEALKTVSSGEHYFNGKMIIDFCDTFAGNRKELTDALLGHFDSFSPFVRQLLLTHFTNQKISEQPVRRKMLICLGSEDKELIIGASKYFGWVNDPKAGSEILRNLTHPDWEVRAISARVSQRGYGSPEMLDALERCLSDRNWYVRLNSAFAFISMVNDQDRIRRIVDGTDRYAREITLYVMFDKNLIDYKQYIEMTKEQLPESGPIKTEGMAALGT